MHTFMFQKHSYEWHFHFAKLPEIFWLMTLFQFASLLVKVPAACIYLNLCQSLLLLQMPLSFRVVLLNHITLGCSIACMALPITFISWRWITPFQVAALMVWCYLPLSLGGILMNDTISGCNIAWMGSPTFISWSCSDKWHCFRLQHCLARHHLPLSHGAVLINDTVSGCNIAWQGITYLYLMELFWWMTPYQVAALILWCHLLLTHEGIPINDTVSSCNIACVASPTFISWSCSDEWYYVRLQHRLYGIT